MIRFLIFIMLASFAIPVTAQEAADFASGCADDRGADRCSDAAVKSWRERYALPAIEQLADDGAAVRRVFYVDGYGRDVLAISAIRAKGASPIIELRVPRTGEAEPIRRLRTISENAWDQILADSAVAHRRYQPEASADPEEISICLHAWVTRYEASDPRQLAQYIIGQQWQEAQTRAVTASACADTPTDAFGAKLAWIAADNFAECSALQAAGQRNGVSLLETCLALSGDTFAAAHATKALRGLELLWIQIGKDRSWTDKVREDYFLASQDMKSSGSIDWDRLSKLFAGVDFINFDVDQTHGIDSQHARMTGELSWTLATDDNDPLTKPNRASRNVELMWIEQAGSWVLHDFKFVGGPKDKDLP